MRIIAGQYKGHPIKAPQGDITRPTVDRVRESLMSTIMSLRGGFEDASVLDAFAGSGALGLEVLSRGGTRACFCERDKSVIRVLKSNIASLKIPHEQYRIENIDVIKRIDRLSGQEFDLVFLDPPYKEEPEDICSLILRMVDLRLLQQGCLICYEHEKNKDSSIEAAVNSIQLDAVSYKRFGDTSIHIMRYE